jgi:hypothetical protein
MLLKRNFDFSTRKNVSGQAHVKNTIKFNGDTKLASSISFLMADPEAGN